MTVIKGQTTTTYRIVCPNFGARNHATHTQDSPTLEQAESRAEAIDRMYERLTKSDAQMSSYYRSEIGWIVQKQTVPQWENA